MQQCILYAPCMTSRRNPNARNLHKEMLQSMKEECSTTLYFLNQWSDFYQSRRYTYIFVVEIDVPECIL